MEASGIWRAAYSGVQKAEKGKDGWSLAVEGSQSGQHQVVSSKLCLSSGLLLTWQPYFLISEWNCAVQVSVALDLGRGGPGVTGLGARTPESITRGLPFPGRQEACCLSTSSYLPQSDPGQSRTCRAFGPGPLGRGGTSLWPWLGYLGGVHEDWGLFDKWQVPDSLRRSLRWDARGTWSTQLFLIQDSPAGLYRNLERPREITLPQPGSTVLWAVPDSQGFPTHLCPAPPSEPTLTSPQLTKPPKHTLGLQLHRLPFWNPTLHPRRPGPRPQPASTHGWFDGCKAAFGACSAQLCEKRGRRRTEGDVMEGGRS